MNAHHVYVPIIKGKKNDLDAVSKLSDEVRALIKPLVEAMPVDRKKATVEAHIEKFVNYIVKYLPSGEMFVDFYGLSPDVTMKDGTNAIIAGFNLLKKYGRAITPTYGLERNDDLWHQFKAIVNYFEKGFCFRISIDDLDDKSEETWAQVIERTSSMGLSPAQVDIVIDLRFVGDKDENDLKNLVIDFLAFNTNASKYRSVTVVGSSALKTVTEIKKDGVGEVTRIELGLWFALLRDVDESIKLLFGDYGVIHPDFIDMGPNPHINAKIRYTAGSKILYFRGHGLRRPKKDYVQYHDLAAKVCADKRYLGANVSYGDNYILQCSHKLGKTGSPNTWVLSDMNHHVSYTARQTERLIALLNHKLSEVAAINALETV